MRELPESGARCWQVLAAAAAWTVLGSTSGCVVSEEHVRREVVRSVPVRARGGAMTVVYVAPDRRSAYVFGATRCVVASRDEWEQVVVTERSPALAPMIIGGALSVGLLALAAAAGGNHGTGGGVVIVAVFPLPMVVLPLALSGDSEDRRPGGTSYREVASNPCDQEALAGVEVRAGDEVVTTDETGAARFAAPVRPSTVRVEGRRPDEVEVP